MESPLSIFLFLYLGIYLALLPSSIHSKQQELQSAPPPPPPPPWQPPPPPPPSRSSSTRPPEKTPHSPDRLNTTRSSPHHKKRRPPPSPPPPRKLNKGKKLGLVFAGFAGILQVFVVTYLVINRRQLMKAHDRYEQNR